MKCPFCAEEIQDEAILCRFCGAKKINGGWLPPSPPTLQSQPRTSSARKSIFTIRAAAVFFLVSAFLEVMSLTSTIPLFGAIRGGVVAVGYHLLYIVLFLGMGTGLWKATSWGYRLMVAGTIVYTLDKMIYLLERTARAAEITQQLQGYGAQDTIDPNTIIGWMNLVAVLSIACWWGFLIYLYFHRDYFKASSE